ncbi:MAG: branched-chain amino acid ABC transporter permease [Nocardioidaceae bacterium]|nr:branched-chain amino acid ABC transporter permease [Nocardioidaceae bacterium]
MNWISVLTQTLEQALGPSAVIYCLAAIGLNVHFGYTGLLNFGQAAFMMVAAYSLGSLVSKAGWNFWLTILVGLAAAVVLALLLGVPTLRLRADYLAIVTIAAAEAVRLVLGSVTLKKYFNGQDGVFGFTDSFAALNPFNSSMGFSFGDNTVSWRPYQFFVIVTGWTVVAICCLIVFLLMRSPWGRVLKGIREDEDAVRSLGKNVYSYKMQSLVIGGLFGALAGFYSGLAYSNASPSDFVAETTFYAYTILLLGGAARVLGPVVGAIIFWGFLSGLDLVFDKLTGGGDPILPAWIMTSSQASLMRLIALGLVLMLLMIYRPQGIFGNRRELALDAR